MAQLTGIETWASVDLIAMTTCSEAFMPIPTRQVTFARLTRSINHQFPLDLSSRISICDLMTKPALFICAWSKNPSKNCCVSRIIFFGSRLLAWRGCSVGPFAVVGVVQQHPGFDNMPVGQVMHEALLTMIVQSNRWTVAEAGKFEDRLKIICVTTKFELWFGTSGMFSYGRVVSYGTER